MLVTITIYKIFIYLFTRKFPNDGSNENSNDNNDDNGNNNNEEDGNNGDDDGDSFFGDSFFD